MTETTPTGANKAVAADLMRAAELSAYEALKEDHREPPALWSALIHRAVAAVLPLHEQQVRERVKAELAEETGADEAAGRVQAFLDVRADRYSSRSNVIEEIFRYHLPEEAERLTLTVADLCALLAESRRFHEAIEANSAEWEKRLIGVHEDRDHWQEQAVVATARAEKAEARLARRAEMDAAAKPLQDHLRRLRGESDRQARGFSDELIAENCDLRTEVEQLRARLDEIGDGETEWGYGRRPSDAQDAGNRNDAYDLAQAYSGRVYVREVYRSDWREADDARTGGAGHGGGEGT